MAGITSAIGGLVHATLAPDSTVAAVVSFPIPNSLAAVPNSPVIAHVGGKLNQVGRLGMRQSRAPSRNKQGPRQGLLSKYLITF